MDIELLGALWQRDDGGNRYSIAAKDLSASLHRSAARLHRIFQLRDWAESSAGFVIGGFFVAYAVALLPNALGTGWIDHWDWLLLGFVSWGLAVVFAKERIHSRKDAPRPSDDVCATLKRQNKLLRHQISLCERIAWWYVLPVAVPMAIIIWRSSSFELKIPYSIIIAVLFGGIIFLNRWYAKRRLFPQLQANEKMLKDVS